MTENCSLDSVWLEVERAWIQEHRAALKYLIVEPGIDLEWHVARTLAPDVPFGKGWIGAPASWERGARKDRVHRLHLFGDIAYTFAWLLRNLKERTNPPA